MTAIGFHKSKLFPIDFSIDARRRHLYLIGATGVGKSSLMERLALSDIRAGHGVCFIDPHGQSAQHRQRLRFRHREELIGDAPFRFTASISHQFAKHVDHYDGALVRCSCSHSSLLTSTMYNITGISVPWRICT